jgi:hypothetical protein
MPKNETTLFGFIFVGLDLNIRINTRDQVDHFLFGNLWIFYNVSSLNETNLNSSVYTRFTFKGSTSAPERAHPQPGRLQSTKHSLLDYVCVGSIRTELFESFALWKSIYAKMNSLVDFFHRIGIEWCTYFEIKPQVNKIDSFFC